MATKKQLQLQKMLQDFQREFREAQREVTYEEAEAFFRQIAEMIKQVRQQNAVDVAKMKEISKKDADDLRNRVEKAEKSLRTTITESFNRAFGEQQGALNFIRDKVTAFEKKREKADLQLIDEIMAMIPELPELPPDLTAEVNDNKEMIEKLEKKIEEVDKKPVGKGGGGGGTSAIGVASALKFMIKNETPSGLINGSNTSYTVTQNINAVMSFGINGQVIHPSEYTYSGKTITMDTAIPAALSGTVFEITYV